MTNPSSKTLLDRDSSWRQRSELESMAELSPELEKEIGRLDKEFWVSSSTLKSIVKQFQKDLKAGLESDRSAIPMNPTWVFGLPSGKEKGTYMAVDLGGTNLRVCKITLHGNSASSPHTLDQEEYKLPEEIKTSSASDLWNHVTDVIATFLSDKGLDKEYTENKAMPLGFTFSYPATQHRIDHGILQTWTKGFDISGVEGEDVVAQLRTKISERKLPVKLVALANDTVGAMIASAYNDRSTIVGAIFGTGCNAAYMQRLVRSPPSIPKLTLQDDEWDVLVHEENEGRDTRIAINCEYGAFGSGADSVLPLTKYDETIDRESPRPGEQGFEKLSAGLYLGEIWRLVMLELYGKGLVFKDQDTTMLKEAYALDTRFLSRIEDDDSHNFQDTRKLFENELSIKVCDEEIETSRRVAELIALRGARLCACGIAAICLNEDLKEGHVAADGSVANKHPKFKKRWASALGEILDWEVEDSEKGPIRLISAEDGSGVGVAVIAAMTVERKKRGMGVGTGK
ncbi:hexokinase-domain-containing protein [Dendryphion nanum]|uniref:Phosphotransferase n=1 Tax=Dendryphion nanum TaxID=256645 RepID=A0A9P9IW98_9PLEO|nr:hexokinase-domain-containing protein [Dendryphion nanum]